ncbi:heparin-binding hemagglutinin [Gordonia sp. DT30]|uniref:heparin-binding hemagglutinin n=1 Tax=unclassified Gordonia (in: high G+C Gram-positive bacteria) TaxID=2657482 RepID=UPI003CEABDB4
MSTVERTLANPFYAVVGAGDLAVTQVTETLAQLRERTETASTRFGETKSRLNSLPEEVPSIDELRSKLTPEELRKVAEPYVELATTLYNSLAERGEETVERLRRQPLVQEGLTRAEKTYNDAVDLTEDALGVVSSQTRSVGEQAAKIAGLVGARVGEAGDAIDDAADAIGDRVDEAALEVNEKLDDASEAVTEAGETLKSRTGTAASKIDGAAGTVEGRARTASSSPAKKIAAAKKAPAKRAPVRKSPGKTTN